MRTILGYPVTLLADSLFRLRKVTFDSTTMALIAMIILVRLPFLPFTLKRMRQERALKAARPHIQAIYGTYRTRFAELEAKYSRPTPRTPEDLAAELKKIQDVDIHQFPLKAWWTLSGIVQRLGFPISKRLGIMSTKRAIGSKPGAVSYQPSPAERAEWAAIQSQKLAEIAEVYRAAGIASPSITRGISTYHVGCGSVLTEVGISLIVTATVRRVAKDARFTGEKLLWIRDLKQPDPSYSLPLILAGVQLTQQLYTLKRRTGSDPIQPAAQYIALLLPILTARRAAQQPAVVSVINIVSLVYGLVQNIALRTWLDAKR